MTGDGLRCPAHPEAAAVAACVECGRWVCADCRRVGADGLARCAQCVAEAAGAQAGPEPGPAASGRRAHSDPPAPPGRSLVGRPSSTPPGAAEPAVQVVGPTPVPWEQPRRFGDVAAFALTAREALLGPTRYMGRVPWARRDLRTPLVFAVLAGVLGQLGLMLITRFVGPPAGMSSTAGGFAQLPVGGALTTAPLLPLMVTVSIFVGSWLAHAMLRLAGDPPRPYEATFRVYAYAEVSSLLLLVPWVGPYAARFYFVFLLLTGLRLAQNAGFSASLLAMAPSVVLMWVLV